MPRGFKSRRNWADEVEPNDVRLGDNTPEPIEQTPEDRVVNEATEVVVAADDQGGEGGDGEAVSDTDKIEGDLSAEREAEDGTSDNETGEAMPTALAVVEDVEPAVPDANVAPFGHQYNWDTATWTAPRGSGTKPCGCNRLVGHGCELTTKSRFATGHDARFKGILQKAFRQGEKLEVDFGPEDNAFIENSEGVAEKLEGRYLMEADQIARLLAPKLLPHVTHDTRAAKLQKADAEAGTVVPQTAVEGKPDEELTDADVEAQTDDAPRDAEFVEA